MKHANVATRETDISGSFERDGFVILDLLTEEMHAALRQLVVSRLEELARNEAQIQPFAIHDLGDYHRLKVPDEVHGRLLAGATRFLVLPPALRQPFLSPKLFPIMDCMWGQHDRVSIKRVDLDGRLVDNQCGFRIARPNTADATLAHTDSDDGVFSLFTMWVPLVGFDSRYTLKIFPGSHRARHPSSAIVKNDRLAALPYSEEYVSQFEPYRPEMKPGQVIAFHNELLHGGADNLGDRTRASAEIRIVGQL